MKIHNGHQKLSEILAVLVQQCDSLSDLTEERVRKILLKFSTKLSVVMKSTVEQALSMECDLPENEEEVPVIFMLDAMDQTRDRPLLICIAVTELEFLARQLYLKAEHLCNLGSGQDLMQDGFHLIDPIRLTKNTSF